MALDGAWVWSVAESAPTGGQSGEMSHSRCNLLANRPVYRAGCPRALYTDAAKTEAFLSPEIYGSRAGILYVWQPGHG